jgi:hypothetical protein
MHRRFLNYKVLAISLAIQNGLKKPLTPRMDESLALE